MSYIDAFNRTIGAYTKGLITMEQKDKICTSIEKDRVHRDWQLLRESLRLKPAVHSPGIDLSPLSGSMAESH